jgi:protein CpxP
MEKQKRSLWSIIMLFGAMVLFSGFVHSQPMRMTVEERVKSLKDTLALTDEQAEKVKKIYTDSDKQREKLFSDSDGDRDKMRESMMKMREDTDKKIESLLTADQKKKYDEIKKARQSRMRGNRGQQPPSPPKEENKK